LEEKMGWFSRKTNQTSLLAISLKTDGLRCAVTRLQADTLPRIEFLTFYPKGDKTWNFLLERLAKEVDAKQFKCSLLLSLNEYQLFALDAMNVPPEEIKSAVRWRLKDMLDYHTDDATIDVFDIPGDTHNNGRNASLIAVVARNQLIAERQNLFKQTRLNLQVIDIADMAQRNLSCLLAPEGRGLAMLSFDENGGLLTLTFNNELYLSRRLDINLSALQVDDEQARFNVFERISLELQRSLDHFERQHNYITTAKLVLAPMGEIGAVLQTYLASNMYMPIELMDLSKMLDVAHIPELKEAQQQHLFYQIIGASLRKEEVAL
jgi:MSHA biogenesis protein MshI